MKYSIPLNKLEKISKIMRRYQKKSSNIVFNIGEEVVENGMLHFKDARSHTMTSMPIKVKCVEVFVDGIYVINGWKFVGTIEFTELGNIIRLADSSFEGKVPAKYLHTPKICEHCGTIRNRKDTYLIYNVEKDEFKQVGSKCLLDYTKGLDANECASIMSCLDKFVENSCKDYCDDEIFTSTSCNCGIDAYDVKRHAIALVKKYGYRKMEDGVGSANDLADFIFRNSFSEVWEQLYGALTLASKEEVEDIDNFAQNYVESDNTYMRNASLAWLNSYVEYRDFGLIASFVNTYLKEMSKIQENLNKSTSEYQGNASERITLNVVKSRVLYTKYSHYTYYGEATYVQELIDDKGNVYIWSSQEDLGMYFEQDTKSVTIRGTVKDHKEYKGIQQTVLSRCRVLSVNN